MSVVRVRFGPEYLTKPPLVGCWADASPIAFEKLISAELWDDLFVWDDLFQDRFLEDDDWKASFEGRLYARMAPRLMRRVSAELGPEFCMIVDLWPVLGYRCEEEASRGERERLPTVVSELMVRPPLRAVPLDGLSPDLQDDLFIWDDLFQDRYVWDPSWRDSFEGRLYAHMAARLALRVKEELGSEVAVDLWPTRGRGKVWVL